MFALKGEVVVATRFALQPSVEQASSRVCFFARVRIVLFAQLQISIG